MASQAETVAKPALIPAPASLEPREGSFRFDAATPIFAGTDAERRVAARFAEWVARTNGVEGGIRSDANGNGVVFAIDPAVSADAPEGYALDVTSQGIRVAASDERGLFYGSHAVA